MAERVHAAGTHDEMQRGREQDRDQHVDAEHQRIGRALFANGSSSSPTRTSAATTLSDRRRGADRVVGLGRTAHRRLRAPEQPVRPHDQHDRHDQELGDQRELGEVQSEAAEIHHAEPDAQRLDLGDDDGGKDTRR